MAKQNGFRRFQLSDSYLNLIVGTLVVIIIAIVVVGLVRSKTTQIPPQAQDQNEAQQEIAQQTNLPKKHKVARGEDLWKISEKYYKTGFNWVDIAKENNLTNPNALTENMELTIPNVTPVLTTAETPKPTVTTAPQVSDSAPEKGVQPEGAITGDTYTVIAGDNLWNIALRAYGDGYKWINIARANKLVNPNIIHPGNNFTIPR